MKKSTKIVIVIVVLILVFALVVPIYMTYSWGEKGELDLTISLDKDTIDIDGTITVTWTLENVGDTKVRIIPPSRGHIRITDSNGTRVWDRGPDFEAPPPPTNRDLRVFKPGETITMKRSINDKDWELRSNETYSVYGFYTSVEEESVTLPFWKGELQSNKETFTIT
jgi:hypothetical protein